MPSNDRSGLFQGLLQGNQAQNQKNQLQQQWMQHLQDMEIKRIGQQIQQQQQDRLAKQFSMQEQLHPFNLQELQNKIAQQQASSTQSAQEAPLNLDKLKAQIDAQKALAEQRRNNPYSKQTPEEKKKSQLDLYREKEKIKQEMKPDQDLFSPTKQTQNQAQKTILAINTIKPLMEDLIALAVPGKFEQNFKPAKAAFANMLQNLGTEEFQAIFNLPKDQHSVKMVEKMVDRRLFEGLDDYKNRLKDLYARVMHKGQMMNNVLKNKTVKFDSGATHAQDSENKDPLGIL